MITSRIKSESNDKPNQGYENTIISTGINTGFEQYKNIFTILGITASYDDLRTDSNASSSLAKQSGEFSEIAGSYGFKYDGRVYDTMIGEYVMNKGIGWSLKLKDLVL